MRFKVPEAELYELVIMVAGEYGCQLLLWLLLLLLSRCFSPVCFLTCLG